MSTSLIDDHLDEYKFDDHLDEYKFDHCRYSVLSLSVTFTGCFVDNGNLDHRTVGLEFSTETTLHLARLWAVSKNSRPVCSHVVDPVIYRS